MVAHYAERKAQHVRKKTPKIKFSWQSAIVYQFSLTGFAELCFPFVNTFRFTYVLLVVNVENALYACADAHMRCEFPHAQRAIGV